MGKIRNNVIVCCENVGDMPHWKYINTKDNEAEIVKDKENILIKVHDEVAMKLPIGFYKNGIVIVVKENTPQKVVEFSLEKYIERVPTYEDHILSNMVKEEMIELKKPIGFKYSEVE